MFSVSIKTTPTLRVDPPVAMFRGLYAASDIVDNDLTKVLAE